MQNLINIYNGVVQVLLAFSLKDLNLPKWFSIKPRHFFAYQWLDNVRINKYAKFDPNKPCDKRVISIFTTC